MRHKSTFLAAIMACAFSASAPSASADPSNCRIELHSLSRYEAGPGEELTMLGKWGPEQGPKDPRINHGYSRALEVLDWSNSALKVRLPENLKPGPHKIGVYCDLDGGNPFSSAWEDFKVLTKSGAPASEYPEPPPEAKTEAAAPPLESAGLPDGPWRERFEEKWREAGRRAAREKPWLASRTVVAVGDEGVSLEALDAVSASVQAQLKDLGAVRLTARNLGSSPREISRCSSDGVLDENCFREAVHELRRGDRDLAGSILLVVTNSAIGLLPREQGNGVTVGPPAGTASGTDGWILSSEFWRLKNRSARRFAAHGREHTARHEVFHLLGLPHHQAIENPGFPEPRLCTQCTHKGAGGHRSSPHAECGMICGSGDDDWFHQESFGRGFGFCPKCTSAARAVIHGLEE